MFSAANDWTTAARSRLLTLRQRDGGWGYRPRSTPAAEPAALAGLALLSSGPADADRRAEATGAARWIAERCRRPDGSTAVSARSERDTPGWTTATSLLLWDALRGFESERRAAVAWLLATRGKGNKPVPNNPMGHDTTLIGWPWVADTHSWVEPTATALLALAPSVPPDQPRMREGIRVLVDRAISTGGWNLGNPIVFGQTFRPLPGPTGLALLALARVEPARAPAAIISDAFRYLRGAIEQTAAPVSLGWGVLGLRAWGATIDPPIAARLAGAADRILARDPGPVELALLLLASGDASLDLLGITPSPMPEAAR